MSNWVISVNIKQLALKKIKIDSLRDAAFQHLETVRKPKKWGIWLVPELTYVAMLTVIIKYQKTGLSALYWEDLQVGRQRAG